MLINNIIKDYLIKLLKSIKQYLRQLLSKKIKIRRVNKKVQQRVGKINNKA